MKGLVIAGVGSRIMMDDGIGIYLAEDLREMLPDIKFVIAETDVDYCFSELSTTKYIVIIDALTADSEPGKITVEPLCCLKPNNDISYSMHGLHIIDIMIGSGSMPEGIMIGIEPFIIDYGFCLSENMKKCYPSVLEAVFECVADYIKVKNGGIGI